ncbi:MAG: hypothetical protein ACLFPF_06140 [Halanaerobiales bacterium]
MVLKGNDNNGNIEATQDIVFIVDWGSGEISQAESLTLAPGDTSTLF